jgi:undecaprenyl diphosphate synthase
MALFQKKGKAEEIGANDLPRHIAIIMDGNGRWAKKRGLPRTAGHAAGAETFRRIATYCKGIGVEYLTVYAFSTENWKRPPEEVAAIMGLLEKYLGEAIEKMERDGIRLKFFGDTSVLSEKLRGLIRETDDITAHLGRTFQANVCVNYGGRDEIVRAARAWAERVKSGGDETLDEDRFASLLDSAGIPDPELLIRPGGEKRISNFLMWQSAYSELVFTDTLWPDFGEKDINAAIAEYARRSRRFGGL